MILAFLLTASISSSALSDDPSPYYGWSVCPGYDDTYGTLTSISLSGIPTSGIDTNLTMVGKVNKSFFCPYVHMKVKVGPITIFDGNYEIDTTFTAGTIMNRTALLYTSAAPPGKYVGRAIIFDNTQQGVACADYWFILRRNPGDEDDGLDGVGVLSHQTNLE